MLFALVGLTACNSSEFPSPVENFTIDDFNKEFFESYSLVIVPFGLGHWAEQASLYTVFIDNNNIYFVFEIEGLRATLSVIAFMTLVIIQNEMLVNYDIGGVKQFYVFGAESVGSNSNDLSNWFGIEIIALSSHRHRRLRNMRRDSITHTVANVFNQYDQRLLLTYQNNIMVISNTNMLNNLLDSARWH